MWLIKSSTARTLIAFKVHFTKAHNNLKATREKTIRSVGYHQANMLVSQVLTEVKNVQNTVLQVLEAHTYKENDENEPPTGHSANIMSTGYYLARDATGAERDEE